MKIEEIEMGTYANQDIMTRSVNLWAKQNELIRAFNGLYDAVEALSHSIPPKTIVASPEEMGYIKLDEDSLRKFMESDEGQEIGRRYKQIVVERTKTDEDSLRKFNGQEDSTVKHFRVAIESIKAIAFHNAASPDDSLRLDPQYVARGKFGTTIGVRQLAQRALDELTEALNTIHITQGGIK